MCVVEYQLAVIWCFEKGISYIECKIDGVHTLMFSNDEDYWAMIVKAEVEEGWKHLGQMTTGWNAFGWEDSE
jgi:hypothetical protein